MLVGTLIQIFLLVLFYYSFAIMFVVFIDSFENLFTTVDNLKQNSFILLLEIVSRIMVNAFVMQYIPTMINFINYTLLDNFFSTELVFKYSLYFTLANMLYDVNLNNKINVLKTKVESLVYNKKTANGNKQKKINFDFNVRVN
uniref:Uncharacterized protein n=1 Tax=viral metagenome TaxID=1070528 RepID=A0A6C0CPP9_9ZZZZ